MSTEGQQKINLTQRYKRLEVGQSHVRPRNKGTGQGEEVIIMFYKTTIQISTQAGAPYFNVTLLI